MHLHIGQAFVPEAVFLAHLLRGLPYVAHLHFDVEPSGAAGFLLRAYRPLVLGRVLELRQPSWYSATSSDRSSLRNIVSIRGGLL